MTPSSHNFLGIPEEFSSYTKAAVAVLPVPFEHTVSYGGGTHLGPKAIIDASSQVELYDEELGSEPYEVGIATLDPIPLEGASTQQMTERVKKAVTNILNDNKLPFVFGGEHSITPPIVQAIASLGDVTVVQLDAHADLRQEYEGDPMSHASAMARVREICPAVQVGIRNLSREEADWIRRDKLDIFFAHEMKKNITWMTEAIAAIKTEKVYITIDIDAFDSSIMPATGTPEPGGMDWYQVTNFLRMLSQQRKVVGFDLVELAPIKSLHACDFLTAKLAYKCIGYWRKSRGSGFGLVL